MASEVDRSEVDVVIDKVNAIMSAHAGGVDLDTITDDGVVKLHFTGLCTGCALRPVTMESVVKPAMASVIGVISVEAAGARISEEAANRFARYLGSTVSSPLPAVSAERGHSK